MKQLFKKRGGGSGGGITLPKVNNLYYINFTGLDSCRYLRREVSDQDPSKFLQTLNDSKVNKWSMPQNIFKKMSESAPTLTFTLWFYVKWTVSTARMYPACMWKEKGLSSP